MSEHSQSVGQANGYSGPPASGITVGELIDRYLAAYVGRDTSRHARLAWWRAQLGDRPLASIVDDDIFHALEDLAARPARVYHGKDADGRPIFKAKAPKRAPATINRYAAAAAAVFTWAVRKRLVPKGWDHPCKGIERQPEHNERVRFLSNEERQALLAACKASKWPKLYLLVLAAITSGARRGELLGLKVEDIDLERAVALLGRSKNGDRRILPLVPAVVAELRRLMPKSPGALVFHSRLRTNSPYCIGTAWTTALRAAKVGNCRFHDLRHTCASYLAADGATLLEIADVLGHRQLSVTRRYSHLTTGHKAALIGRVLGDIK